MKMKKAVLVLLGVCLLAFTSIARAEFKGGKWSITEVMKVDIPNMPPQYAAMNKGQTTTNTSCFVNQDDFVRIISKSYQGCQETHQANGDTVTFQSTCNNGNIQTTYNGNLTFNGNSMQGHMDGQQKYATGTNNYSYDITGQYLGPVSSC